MGGGRGGGGRLFLLPLPPLSFKMSEGGHGRDLRELLAERRGPRRPSGSAVDDEEGGGGGGERVNVSSVVKLVERWDSVIISAVYIFNIRNSSIKRHSNQISRAF